MLCHMLNRANARMRILDEEGVYAAFEKVLVEAHERVAVSRQTLCEPVCRMTARSVSDTEPWVFGICFGFRA